MTTDSKEIMESLRSEIKDCIYKVSKSRNPKYWWHSGLEVYYRRFVAARKKSQDYPSYNNLEELYIAKREWERVVKEAKRDKPKTSK